VRGAVIPTSERDPRVEVVHLDDTTRLKTPKAALEQLRDAVAAVRAAYPGVSLTWALQRGIELVVVELRERYHGGAPFPARTERRLKPGRRPRLAATPSTEPAGVLEEALLRALTTTTDEDGRGER
jgi:hypothetical protein